MKLHKDGNEQFILTSDDIISSGNNIGKKLTSIIDEHSHDINDLKKYTKWLYKNGGMVSKELNLYGMENGVIPGFALTEQRLSLLY